MFKNRSSAREATSHMPQFCEQLHSISDPKRLLEEFRAARLGHAMVSAHVRLGGYKMAIEQFSRSPADHAVSLSGGFNRFFNSLRDAVAALSGAQLAPAEHAAGVAQLHAHILDAHRSSEALAEQFEGATVADGGVSYPKVLSRALETLSSMLEESAHKSSPTQSAHAPAAAPRRHMAL